VKAFVVAVALGDDFAEELQELVRRDLSPHEYPRQVEFVDSLPTTTNGKLDRRTLRERA
jgi:acetyl-CoA synthetase